MSGFRLRKAVWEITLGCCFSCEYCGSKAGKARENELTTEECLDVADQLGKMGVTKVSLIGGEVFMRKDWNKILARLSENGIHTAVITNGFLFTPSITDALKEAGVASVAVSIDGPADIHDKYRQKGSFTRAINAVDTLSKEGIPVAVISTLNSENVNRLPEMYDILSEHDIFAWQLQACSPMGNAAESGIDHRFKASEVISFIREHKDNGKFVIGMADNIGYFTPDDRILRGGNAFFPGCQAGISSIGIDSIGNVRGCESMYDSSFIEGNLRERSLEDIWNDPKAFLYNRNFDVSKLTGKCASCDYGYACAGGCRSYNFFVHGNLYEAPACAKNE